jgi:Spy/CpxP family protein refolding chaperone
MNGLLKWKIALYLTVIFALGSLTGWMAGTKTTKEKMLSPQLPDPVGTRMRDDLHKELDLSPEQKTKVDSILEQNSKDMKTLFDSNLQRIRQLSSNRDAQIVGLLSPEQKNKFEDLQKKRYEPRAQERRRFNRRGGPGPGPGSGTNGVRPNGPGNPPMWRGGPPTNSRPNFKPPWLQNPTNDPAAPAPAPKNLI